MRENNYTLLCTDLVELTPPFKIEYLFPGHQAARPDGFVILHQLPRQARAMHIFVVFSNLPMTTQRAYTTQIDKK